MKYQVCFTLHNQATLETDFNYRSSYSTFKKNGNLNVRFIMLKGNVHANLTTRNKNCLCLASLPQDQIILHHNWRYFTTIFSSLQVTTVSPNDTKLLIENLRSERIVMYKISQQLEHGIRSKKSTPLPHAILKQYIKELLCHSHD